MKESLTPLNSEKCKPTPRSKNSFDRASKIAQAMVDVASKQK